MSKYPPYACKCCGFANGDMFADYYNFKPTQEQTAQFDAYRKVWNMLNAERQEARAIISQKRFTNRKHTQATKAKISATKLRSKI